MTTATAILGLIAETPLHAGTGQTFGLIDLPIQREAHTGFPCVFGSGMKGALRARAEERHPDQVNSGWICDVFGPPSANASEHAGALAVTDARLLLLPVRSLTSYYKWVTCPAILRRYQQDYRRLLGGEPFPLPEALTPSDTEVLLVEARGDLFLEEFRFTAVARSEALKPVVAALATLLSGEAKPAQGTASPRYSELERQLRQRLAVVSDDLFTHLCRFATPVAAHIRIEGGREVKKDDGTSEWQPGTKTVKSGALWYEETLPPETVLYTGLLAQGSRRERKDEADGAPPAADGVLDRVRSLFPAGQDYLQIGGNETVGMGWCRVAVLAAGRPGQGG